MATNHLSGVEAAGHEDALKRDIVIVVVPYPRKPWPILVPRDYVELPALIRKPCAALWLLQDHAWERRRSRAMPRDLATQINYVRMLLGALPEYGRIHLILDKPRGEAPTEIGSLFTEVVTPARADHRARFDALAATLDDRSDAMPVLVYADAIGYGNGPLERLVRGLVGDRALILNGRRRLFRLDAATRRALVWRRLLARSRLVEVGLAAAAVVAGCTLAAWDRLTGPIGEKQS